MKWPSLNRFLPGHIKASHLLLIVSLIAVGSVCLGISQITTSEYSQDSVTITDIQENATALISRQYLQVDQILGIRVELSNGTGILSIRYVNSSIIRTAWMQEPRLTFLVDGFSNYSFWIYVDSYNEEITTTYWLETRTYPYVQLFPAGLFLVSVGLLLILRLIPFDLLRLKRHEQDSETVIEPPGNNLRSLLLGKSHLLLPFAFLVVIFLFLTVTDIGYVHNDSVGGGLSGPEGQFEEIWNYVAWGYLDFAEMVRSNLFNGDFSYTSWAMIHGSSKNIGLPILVGFLSYATGIGVFVIYRLTVRFFFVILAAAVGLIASTLTRDRKAFYIAALFIVTNPILLEYSRSLYQEIPLSAMLALALFFLIRASNNGSHNLLLSAIFLGISSMFKSILMLIPFIFGLLLLLVVNAKKRNWDLEYLFRGFFTLGLLGIISLCFYFLSYPLRWTNPIGKLLGYSQTSWVASEGLMLLHNMGFLAFFLLFQTPLLVMGLVLLTPWMAKRYPDRMTLDLPLAILLGYIPFYIIETRLLQHHMVYSLWSFLLIAAICLTKLLGSIRLPSLKVSQKDLKQYLIVVAISINLMLVLPQASYTGMYQNSLHLIYDGPNYFEPTYSLMEASMLIGTYPDLGYVMTVRAPHVLSYYMPSRNVIIPPAYLASQPSSLASLAFIMSIPVDVFVLSEGWFELFPNAPEWVALLMNSGAFRLAHSLAARGIPTIDLYVNRLLHDGLAGDSLLAGDLSVSGNSTAGNLTIGANSVDGVFTYPANLTGTGYSQLSLNLTRAYTIDEAIFLLHMTMSGTYQMLPEITIALYNSTSCEEVIISPTVGIGDTLSLALNFSTANLFSLESYNEIRIRVYDPVLDDTATFQLEIDRIELVT